MLQAFVSVIGILIFSSSHLTLTLLLYTNCLLSEVILQKIEVTYCKRLLLQEARLFCSTLHLALLLRELLQDPDPSSRRVLTRPLVGFKREQDVNRGASS